MSWQDVFHFVTKILQEMRYNKRRKMINVFRLIVKLNDNIDLYIKETRISFDQDNLWHRCDPVFTWLLQHISRHLIQSLALYSWLHLLPLPQLSLYSIVIFGYKIQHKPCHNDYHPHTHQFWTCDITILLGSWNFFLRNIVRVNDQLAISVRIASVWFISQRPLYGYKS